MRIQAIAVNTFREAIRDKVLYSLLFFAFLMIGMAVILDQLTVGERTKIIKDFGLAAIAIFGVLIAIFVGIGLVYKEIERKTIYNILSKPIARYQFLVGKYLGLVMTLFVEVAVMSMALFALLYVYKRTVDTYLFFAIGMTFLELMVITAMALLFSSFSTPILSGLFTLSFYIIGHLTADIVEFGRRGNNLVLKYVSEILYYALPDLNYFNVRSQVVYHLPLDHHYLFWATCYGLFYILLLLLLSSVIFQNRDFK